MKKYTWIVALLIALSVVFMGCPSGIPLDPGGEEGLPLVEVEADDIVLRTIGSGTGQSVEGNKYKLDATGATSAGFAYAFPEEVIGKGYWKIKVELEVVAMTSPGFISFNAKSDDEMATDVLIFGHTQQYHNELKLGEIKDKEVSAGCSKEGCLIYTVDTCIVGATGSAEYPFGQFKKGYIPFQYNPWAGDIPGTPASGSVVANFEIAVTKISFIPVEGEIAKLASPVIELDGTTGIKWTAVEKAVGYNVLADGEKVGSTLAATATDVNLLTMPALAVRPAKYSITLVAVGTPGISDDSDPSNAVEFDKSSAPALYDVPTGGVDLGAITIDAGGNDHWITETTNVTGKNLYVVFSAKPSGGGNFVWQDASDLETGFNGWHNAGQDILGGDGTPVATYATLTGDDKILKINMTAILGTDTPAAYMKLVFQYYGGGKVADILGGYLAP